MEGAGGGGEGGVEVIDQDLAVVPDLVVFLVVEGNIVHPFELLVDRVDRGV